MEQVEITIIGAGVVGLAIAERLSASYKNIFVIEKEQSFGGGTSSRNSEVIHAGIYYPKDSLKAKCCVEGNQLLYEICPKNKIHFKKLGKLIIANNQQETRQIEQLYKQGSANGVVNLEIIDSLAIKKLEPNIEGISALYSPETGIIDSHKLMEYFYTKAKQNGVCFVYNTKVKGIEKKNNSYKIETEDTSKEQFNFTSRIIINSAGLYSDLIAHLAGLDMKKLKYDLKFCKGDYFRLSSNKSRFIERLVYPVPNQSEGGLGIHLTPDISGEVRLGPDAQYLKENIEGYSVDKNKQKDFCESVRKFAPFINLDDIYPDTSGIRPKLQGLNDGFRDFVIKEESENGFPGFVNLIGIESPGLTASPSIAKYVEEILKTILDKIKISNDY